MGSQHLQHDRGRFLIVATCERRAHTDQTRADRRGISAVLLVDLQVSWRLSRTVEERNSSQRISHHSRLKELVALLVTNRQTERFG